MGSLLKDSVVSFFKIMIDHDFLSVLYFPPKFARTTRHLLHKKTYLENLNGQRWNVVVSEENGSLALRKGWKEFSIAHNLGIGDFVLFHYFLGRYFVVQVFNKSACDLRGSMLGNGYPSTRPSPEDTDGSQKTTYDNSGIQEDTPGNGDSNDSVVSASGKGNICTRENNNATEALALAIVPVEVEKAEPTNFEDPEVQFIGIKFCEPSEHRTVIDLSSYEMPSADDRSNIKPTGNELSLPYDGTLVICKAEPDTAVFAKSMQETKDNVEISESAKQKEDGRSLYSDAEKKKYDASTLGSPNLTAFTPTYGHPNVNVQKSVFPAEQSHAPFQNRNAVVKSKETGNEGSVPFASNVVKWKVEPGVTEFRTPKQETKRHVEFWEPTKRKEVDWSLSSDVKKKKYDYPTLGSPSSTDFTAKYDSVDSKVTVPKSVYSAGQSYAPLQSRNAPVKIKNEVKSESFEDTDLSPVTASASDLHCVIRNATSIFLELPGSLPLFTYTPGTSGQKLVILRDPTGKFWPVSYYHKPSTVLNTGWPAFAKANNIQSGDECIFRADSKQEATYDVSIVRKKDRST